MPKIKIEALPKMEFGGGALFDLTPTTTKACDPGYVLDPDNNTNCIPIEEANAKMQKRADDAAAASGIKVGTDFFESKDAQGNPIVTSYDPNNPLSRNTGMVGYDAKTGTVGFLQPFATTTTTTTAKPNALRTIADSLAGSLAFGSVFGGLKEKRELENWFAKDQRRNQFTQVSSPTSRGILQTNTGVARPDIQNQFSPYGMFAKEGGEFYPTKQIVIEEVPVYSKSVMIEDVPELVKMVYGGQTKYGLDITTKNKSISEYTKPDMSESSKNTVTEIKDKKVPKKLEGELGEYLWKPGDGELYRIGGKLHSQGGTKLTSEQVDSSDNPNVPSFIFSKTVKKLHLPPSLLKEQFNINASKKMSPADVAAKFPLNEYKTILNDPYSDKIEKDTAIRMYKKNSDALAKLAIIHETMKGGEPPQFALEMLGDTPKAKHGGFTNSNLPKFKEGSSLFQTSRTTTIKPNNNKRVIGSVWSPFGSTYSDFESVLFSPDNEALRDEVYNRYAKANSGKAVSKDEYFDILKRMQQQLFSFEETFPDDYLNAEQWDWTGTHGGNEPWKNKMYRESAEKLKFTPLTEDEIAVFQQAYRDLADAAADPKFASTWGNRIKLDPQGRRGSARHTYLNQPISQSDEIVGTVTNRERLLGARNIPITIDNSNIPDEPSDKGVKYICVPDQRGNGVVRPSSTGIGYNTPEEAKANCGKPILPPFGYTVPDVASMLAEASNFPIYELPLNPNLAYRDQKYYFEDWQNAVQNIYNAQFKAPGEMLARYTPAQGLQSRLSALSGQAANSIGQQIASTFARNIGIANQAESQMAQRKQQLDTFNLGQKENRHKGRVIAKQQFANDFSNYKRSVVQALNTAYTDAGDLYDTNMLTNYYKDPATFVTKFKGQPANIFGASYIYPGSDASTSSYASQLKQNYDALESSGMKFEDDKQRMDVAVRLTLGQMKGIDNDDNDWMQPNKSSNKR